MNVLVFGYFWKFVTPRAVGDISWSIQRRSFGIVYQKRELNDLWSHMDTTQLPIKDLGDSWQIREQGIEYLFGKE